MLGNLKMEAVSAAFADAVRYLTVDEFLLVFLVAWWIGPGDFGSEVCHLAREPPAGTRGFVGNCCEIMESAYTTSSAAMEEDFGNFAQGSQVTNLHCDGVVYPSEIIRT